MPTHRLTPEQRVSFTSQGLKLAGIVRVPEGPGLGISIDRAALASQRRPSLGLVREVVEKLEGGAS